MGADTLITTIGAGVLAELLVFFLLTRLFSLTAKTAAGIIAMSVLLLYVPIGIITWPGADVFSIHLAIYLTTAYAMGLIGSQKGRGWHWGPAIIVTFFIFVVVINVVFVSVSEQGISGIFKEILPEPRGGGVADSQFPGTVANNYQEKEALYNAYLLDVEKQIQRGWKVTKGWRNKPNVGEPAIFIVTVHDKSGRPINNAAVGGRFLRTSNSRKDFPFTMEFIGSGEYWLRTVMPLPGLWRLTLRVQRGEDFHELTGMTSVQDSNIKAVQ